MITDDNIEDLQGKIDNEGFDYAMFYYSNWEDIEDARFHELRNACKSATKEFVEYLISLGIDADEF